MEANLPGVPVASVSYWNETASLTREEKAEIIEDVAAKLTADINDVAAEIRESELGVLAALREWDQETVDRAFRRGHEANYLRHVLSVALAAVMLEPIS